MGIFGILCFFLWGLIHLPALTSWVIVGFLLYVFVVVLLDQFGLLPKKS